MMKKLHGGLRFEPPALNDEQLAMEWCRCVEGTCVFPKSPAHLRNCRDEWERNRRVRDAARDAKEGNDSLKESNNTLCPQETRDNKESEESDLLPDTEENDTVVPVWPAPQAPLPMERPSFSARHNFPITAVAGTQTGSNPCKTHTKKRTR